MAFNIEGILRMNAEAAEKEKKLAAAAAQKEQILQIPVDELVDFPPDLHKFRPATGQRLADLAENIRLNGILNPLLIRQLPDGSYQILAGHNRRTVARNLGYQTVPCIVKDLPNDDDALLAVVADNLSGRELLPSERGWGYRQELEIRSRQGYRTDLTSTHNQRKLETAEIVGKKHGDGKSKVRRYIRLTYLIPPLLNLVDEKKIGLGTGEQLSYLSQRSQELVYSFCYTADPIKTLKEPQAKEIRAAEVNPDRIVDEELLEELTAKKQKVRLRTLKIEMSKLRDYFPAGTPEEVVVQTIHTALAIYFEEK